jgi:hypothetical protein
MITGIVRHDEATPQEQGFEGCFLVVDHYKKTAFFILNGV